MNKRRKQKSKKKGTAHRNNEKTTGRKSSGKEYLKKMDFQNISITNPEEFLNHTVNNMEEKTKEIMEDPCNAAKRDVIEDELKPMNVTLKVKECIKDIPRSKAVSWYIDVNRRIGEDKTFLHCNIHLVDEKNLLDQKSKLVACIGISVVCIEKDIKNSQKNITDIVAREKDLVMGTFAKTCLYPDSALPLRGLCSGGNVLPAEVILNTSAMVDRMKLDLMELGVSRVSIAQSGLIADGKRVYKKTLIDTRPLTFKKELPTNDQIEICANMREKILKEDDEGDYVSETREDLQGWVPPKLFAPSHWFVKKPQANLPFRPTELYGWRTNLRRAIEKADESKVIEITNAHSSEEVREFCEISILLQLMAAEGLKESCRLLIDYCSVSVEGVQGPNIKDEWWEYMKVSDDSTSTESTTPLLAAACEGYYEVCELLLDRGADVNAVMKEKKKNALHLAAGMGHKDVVKLLCKRHANVSQLDREGNDPIVQVEFIIKNHIYEKTGCTVGQYERITEILREYDINRCSHCKNGVGLLKQCPCHKERYCDRRCQMARW
eukprot:CAMPEP_0203671124 /NCGR_PEP_ID=MMETSP0090-20130426/7007_1 /ASSEMBLY_ACC=CAM_ASM_001088 /TAXON_ID=426623 /ORGANISM="Chaetoceros affinis, Strain CCMP159" /LENGTH=549 /DNA_ID=CAMNT_0050536135 /DNA_START=289 /DNA_END=1935 /DNA_ORIENTATION=+